MFSFGSIITFAATALSAFILFVGDIPMDTSKYITAPKTNALPIEKGIDGRLYISVDVNGRAIRFIVDTAASHSILREQDADIADLTISGVTKLNTAGGKVDAKEGLATSFYIAGTQFKNHRVLVAEDLPVSLLGMDILKSFEGAYITL